METKNNSLVLPVAIVVAGVIITFGIMYKPLGSMKVVSEKTQIQTSELEEKVLPFLGVELPVTWNGLGSKLVSSGVIDVNKFKDVYNQKGVFTNGNFYFY